MKHLDNSQCQTHYFRTGSPHDRCFNGRSIVVADVPCPIRTQHDYYLPRSDRRSVVVVVVAPQCPTRPQPRSDCRSFVVVVARRPTRSDRQSFVVVVAVVPHPTPPQNYCFPHHSIVVAVVIRYRRHCHVRPGHVSTNRIHGSVPFPTHERFTNHIQAVPRPGHVHRLLLMLFLLFLLHHGRDRQRTILLHSRHIQRLLLLWLLLLQSCCSKK